MDEEMDEVLPLEDLPEFAGVPRRRVMRQSIDEFLDDHEKGLFAPPPPEESFGQRSPEVHSTVAHELEGSAKRPEKEEQPEEQLHKSLHGLSAPAPPDQPADDKLQDSASNVRELLAGLSVLKRIKEKRRKKKQKEEVPIEIQVAYVEALTCRAKHMVRTHELTDTSMSMSQLLEISHTHAMAALELENDRNQQFRDRLLSSSEAHCDTSRRVSQRSDDALHAIDTSQRSRRAAELAQATHDVAMLKRKASTMARSRQAMLEAIQTDTLAAVRAKREQQEQRMCARLNAAGSKERFFDTTAATQHIASVGMNEKEHEFAAQLQAQFEADLTEKYDVMMEGLRNQIEVVKHRQIASAVNSLEAFAGRDGVDALTRCTAEVERAVKVQQLSFKLLKDKIHTARQELLSAGDANLARLQAMMDCHFQALIKYIRLMIDQAYERLQRSTDRPHTPSDELDEGASVQRRFDSISQRWSRYYEKSSAVVFKEGDSRLAKIGEEIISSAMDALGSMETAKTASLEAKRRWAQDTVEQLESWAAAATEAVQTRSNNAQQQLVESLLVAQDATFKLRSHATTMALVSNRRKSLDLMTDAAKKPRAPLSLGPKEWLDLLAERNHALSHGVTESDAVRVEQLQEILALAAPSEEVIGQLASVVRKYQPEYLRQQGRWLQRPGVTRRPRKLSQHSNATNTDQARWKRGTGRA